MSLRTRVWSVVGTLVLVPLLAAAAVVAILVPRAADVQTRAVLGLVARSAAHDVTQRCLVVGLAARSLGVEAAARDPADAVAAVRDAGYGDYAAVLGRGGAVVAAAGELPAPATALPGPEGSCSTGAPRGVVMSERVAVRGGARVSAAVVADAVSAAELGDLLAGLGVDDAAVGLVGVGAASAGGTGGELLVAGSGRGLPQAERAELDRGLAAVAATLAAGGRAEAPDGMAVADVRVEGLPLRAVAVAPSPGLGDLARPLGLVAAVAALLALGLGLLVARALTGPLAVLTEAAERVAKGDLEQRLPDRAETDEVGRLSASFSVVTSQLRRNAEALARSRDEMRESLERLGEALQSTHNIDALLQVVLNTAVASSHARAGVALLIDGSDLEAHAVAGLEAPGRVPLGEGVLGRVAETGASVRGPLGTGPGRVQPGAQEPQEGQVLAVPLRRGGVVSGVLAVYGGPDDPPFGQEEEDALRTLAGQAGIAVDNVRLHSEAERLSLTDALTGLRNFRYLSIELAREIERASRFNRPLSVLMLDLDHFKAVNDTYGHARGDGVLRQLASRLSEVKREVDTLARYGGEEFVIVLPETGAEGATMLAERVCAAVRRQPFGEPGEEPLRLTVSVGVAAFPVHGESPAMLLRSADDALYAAKRAGRDQWRLAGEHLDGVLAAGG